MAFEIGECHLAAGQERSVIGDQADHDQESANEFDGTGGP
jgi:hypothetical protein